MGLDNFPATYPCATQGTAVRDDAARIDCAATAQAGGCPWANAPDRPDNGRVVGMLGTYCWYRGKYGEFLLSVLGIGDECTFYGDDEEGTTKSPQSCAQTAQAIRAALERIDDAGLAARLGLQQESMSVEEFRTDATYAAWWLDWTAQVGDGASCWY